jgi:hypothetical protein
LLGSGRQSFIIQSSKADADAVIDAVGHAPTVIDAVGHAPTVIDAVGHAPTSSTNRISRPKGYNR